MLNANKRPEHKFKPWESNSNWHIGQRRAVLHVLSAESIVKGIGGINVSEKAKSYKMDQVKRILILIYKTSIQGWRTRDCNPSFSMPDWVPSIPCQENILFRAMNSVENWVASINSIHSLFQIIKGIKLDQTQHRPLQRLTTHCPRVNYAIINHLPIVYNHPSIFNITRFLFKSVLN